MNWVGTAIICNLLPSFEDGLYTLPLIHGDGDKAINLIVDTGSAGTMIFSKSEPPLAKKDSSVFKFQNMQVGLIRPHSSSSDYLDCSQKITLETPLIGALNANNDITNVADGIIGLGRLKLGTAKTSPPFLFSQYPPQWSTLTLSFPQSPRENGKLTFSSINELHRNNAVPVVSEYYWAVRVLAISSITLEKPVVAIIDSGSNFIGLSDRLYQPVRDFVQNQLCPKRQGLDISLEGEGGHRALFFIERDQYAIGDACNDLAFTKIDSSKLGDLYDNDVIILGTRALAGKTVGIHKAVDKVQYYLSVN